MTYLGAIVHHTRPLSALAIGVLVAVGLSSCSGGSTNDYQGDLSSSQPSCQEQLIKFGHGEANYEAAMLDAPTCDDDAGQSVLYYEYLDRQGIKYPGWPN